MKKFLGWLVVFVLVVGGGVLAFWQVNDWRLYDADWQPLALTSAENYCAGAFGMSNGFKRDDRTTKECTENSQRDNVTPSIADSPAWACQGIVSTGWGGSVYDCVIIFHNNALWLIEGGGWTSSWNDQRPRPAPLDEGILETPNRGSNRGEDVDPLFTIDEEEEVEDE